MLISEKRKDKFVHNIPPGQCDPYVDILVPREHVAEVRDCPYIGVTPQPLGGMFTQGFRSVFRVVTPLYIGG